jgi:hypothetical protein
MKFAKGGLIIESLNPVCDSLYLKQGWVPVVDELIEDKTVEVTEETDENGQDEGGDDSAEVNKKINFTTMSKEKIVELAESLGYKITATKKADMITEFLAQQNT